MESKLLKFNANYSILVKLKDKSIEHFVKEHNKIMPFNMQLSFKEFKSRANENGYHTFQMWAFIEYFGGIDQNGLYDMEIFFKEKDFKTID